MDNFFWLKDAGPVIGVIAAALCVAAVMIAVQWRKLRQTEIDAALKQEMIQRGMSADEITKILAASSEKSEAEAGGEHSAQSKAMS